ncbi:MAG: VOC family protein [Thermoplasmata archaeon]|nr:VOC family protein [Thermoplasmata archaeon]MCI4359711.1 VOC family protein [Thermoplasmata archaeon]
MSARKENSSDSLGTSFAFTELSSEDPAVTRRFLERAFHWAFQSRPMPGGEYLAFEIPGGGQGGIRRTQPTESPASLSYIRVADLDEARRRVEEAGATVVLARVDAPGMGSFFWFKIPGGPILACWQDEPPRDSATGRTR